MPLQDYYWITKDHRKIPMVEMESKHMQSAYIHVCMREIELYNQINIFVALREQLEEAAKSRDIVLKYPDEKFPSVKWKGYFENIRKTNEIKPEKQVENPLASYEGLKDVNTL